MREEPRPAGNAAATTGCEERCVSSVSSANAAPTESIRRRLYVGAGGESPRRRGPARASLFRRAPRATPLAGRESSREPPRRAAHLEPERLRRQPACGGARRGHRACGLAAAALGAPNVVLTDKPDLLPTLQANAAANSFSCSGVGCESLSWSLNGLPSNRLPCGADLVLASDCLNPVYGDDHAVALAATIRDLLHRARRSSAARIEPEALLAQTRRGVEVAERLFFAAPASG